MKPPSGSGDERVERGWQKRLVAIAPFVLTLATGCAAPQHPPYEPTPAAPDVQTRPAKIAVVEFEDFNPPDETTTSGGVFFLSWVPGVLYVTPAQTHASVGLARCLSKELRASREFAQVDYFADWSAIRNRRSEYDLIVSGVLNEDSVRVRTTFYGLSLAGLLLAELGVVPAQYLKRQLDFEIYVLDPNQPNEPLLRDRVRPPSDTRAKLFYYRMSDWGRNAFPACPTEELRPHFARIRQSVSAQAGRMASSMSHGHDGGLP